MVSTLLLEPITNSGNYDATDETIERATSQNCPRQLADPSWCRCSFGNLHLRLVAVVELSFSPSLSLPLDGRTVVLESAGVAVCESEPKAGLGGGERRATGGR